jgi:hypothetical protein
MGKPVKVNGLFSMYMDVLDKSGNSVTNLTSTTPEPTHVIYVENISGRTRSVKFVNTLPNGTTWMEFTGPRVTPGRWEDTIPNIPHAKTRQCRRAILHKAGPAQDEPIQCDEVEQTLGAPPAPGSIRGWKKETNNIPFDHEIDVDP